MEKITLGIEGMMCPMCEAHMNDTIRKAFDVTKVKSSRNKKQTVFYVDKPVTDEEIEKVIKETGYTLLSIERQEK